MADGTPTLRENLRALPRPVWVLVAGTFVNRFGTFVVPFLILYLTERGYSASQASYAIAAYGAGNLVAAWLGGYFTDRLGRKTTTVISMFLSAAVLAAVPPAVEFADGSSLNEFSRMGVLLALIVGAGISAEMYRPASTALLTDLVPAENRVTAFAAYRLAINAGWAFGPATAGLLAKYSYDWLFYGDAITSVIYGVIALVALPQGNRSANAAHASWAPALRCIVRDRRFQLYILAAFGIGFTFFQTHSTLALHVTSVGLTPLHYGLLHSLNGILIILFEIPLTPWTQRKDPQRLIAFGYCIIAIGFTLTAWGGTFALLAITVVIWTFGEIISFPVSGAYVANLAPEDMRGRYMGFMGFVWSTSMIVAPIAGEWLYRIGPKALWLTCGGCCALSAILISIRLPETKKEE